MKKLLAIFLAVCLLAGCQLATTETGEDPMEDKLVGVFVTFDSLNLGIDLESYIRDNGMPDGDLIEPGREYEGRLYAELGETGWEFPGYEGLIMGQRWREDHWAGFTTEGFCGTSTYVSRSDTLDSIEEEGTIYVPSGTEVMLNCNPVYMTPEGDYYVVQGDSFHSGIDSGAMSMSVSEESTWTEGEESFTYSAKFTTRVQGVTLAEKVVFIQMSADHRELARAEYAPEDLPETMEPAEGAAYVVVEEYTPDGVHRTLNQPGDDSVAVYTVTEKVYCLPRFTEILWNE